eukprot:364933-Chlamydomonas_euryale.AAC.22
MLGRLAAASFWPQQLARLLKASRRSSSMAALCSGGRAGEHAEKGFVANKAMKSLASQGPPLKRGSCEHAGTSSCMSACLPAWLPRACVARQPRWCA